MLSLVAEDCPLPVSHSSWEGRVDNEIDKLGVVVLFFG
jgi:hypothetical protein